MYDNKNIKTSLETSAETSLENSLEIKNLSLSYNNSENNNKKINNEIDKNNIILENINFSLKKGDIFALLGHSGSGKSSLLRAIAGLKTIDAGEIYLQNQLISSKTFNQTPQKRAIGMMFQDYALFPHLNAYQNILFALHLLDKKQQIKRADEMLELVGLKDYKNAYPNQLSGGQQQRLALARSLAGKPNCILLDEPFSSLDSVLKKQLLQELKAILAHEKITAIIVTHAADEAFQIANYIGILENKTLMQFDTPYHVYHLPRTPYIAKFLGDGRFIKGLVKYKNTENINLNKIIQTPLGDLVAQKAIVIEGCDLCEGLFVDVLVRPDDVDHDENSPYKAKVVDKIYQGAYFLYTLHILNIKENETIEILALFSSHLNFEIGSDIGIRLNTEYLACFSNF